MEFGIDKYGKRVSAYDANKDEEYFCPCCGNKLLLKTGDLNVWHFAHRSGECVDNWHYDMSEWHQKMQKKFEPKYREVVIKNNGIIHRADILKDGIVIEFQHSPISSEEFTDRNVFYTSAGYRVVWVFDVTRYFDNESIRYLNDDSETDFIWKNPVRIFKSAPHPSENSKEISICFCNSVEEFDYSNDDVRRVYWCLTDDDGDPDYRRFSMNNYCCIDIANDMNLEYFFFTPKEFVYDRVKHLRKYKQKYRGRIKGKAKMDYCCPITNDWINGRKCEYCGYCGFHENFHITKNDRVDVYYCCFPKIVNKKDPYGMMGEEYCRVEELYR